MEKSQLSRAGTKKVQNWLETCPNDALKAKKELFPEPVVSKSSKSSANSAKQNLMNKTMPPPLQIKGRGAQMVQKSLCGSTTNSASKTNGFMESPQVMSIPNNTSKVNTKNSRGRDSLFNCKKTAMFCYEIRIIVLHTWKIFR